MGRGIAQLAAQAGSSVILYDSQPDASANLQTVYGDPRYRPSPWLRRRGALGLSLLHEEQ